MISSVVREEMSSEGERCEEAVLAAQTLVGPSVGLEAALRYLRHEGMSPVQCIKAVMPIGGISLSEAKSIVHCGDAWADVRED